ncbi:polysaccharide deacetylase family protein [Streptococcus massiliensis]|uniref:Peptidoglycan N-acetylglucosamine deacetylase A n=1 Tax=Streptococcus massiliensis TaxID=313439 RepID=A0A380KWA5_9STRE|nr:polysaccharide deacetylase family protein [Streptococcus massiliensis]SUN76028.1 peptidoglycan N-acetylglucosamine deacetylase A [Streptococcus massiliensis]
MIVRFSCSCAPYLRVLFEYSIAESALKYKKKLILFTIDNPNKKVYTKYMEKINLKTVILLALNICLLLLILLLGKQVWATFKERQFESKIQKIVAQHDKTYEKKWVSKRSGQFRRNQVIAYYPTVEQDLLLTIMQKVEDDVKHLSQNERALVFYTVKEIDVGLAKVYELRLQRERITLDKQMIGKPKTRQLDYYYSRSASQVLTLDQLFHDPDQAKTRFEEDFRNQLAFRKIDDTIISDVINTLNGQPLSGWKFRYQDRAFHIQLPKAVGDVTELALPITSLYEVINQEFLKDKELQQCKAYLAEKLKKVVALTFDDGPNPATTPKVLDILKAHHAKATFFTLGQNIAGNEAIMKRVLAEGSEIGNHSWSHPSLPTLPVEQVQKEINDTTAAIKKAVGIDSKIMRPPYGDINLTVQNAVDQSFIMWSVDSLDWKNRDTNAILSRIKEGTQPGSIILMHDIHQTTVDALPAILDYLDSQGYGYVTVSELLEKKLAPHQIYYSQN